jgi:hypothetical protein
MLRGMSARVSAAIHASVGPCGTTTYLVAVPPEHLPAVRHTDLARAWDAARQAAAQDNPGAVREIVFRRDGGAFTRLVLADPDARCWAQAVDAMTRLNTLQGMALCLRLLALVELLARAPGLACLYRLRAGTAELHPALLRAAAGLALDPAGLFDEAALRRQLPVGFAAELHAPPGQPA